MAEQTVKFKTTDGVGIITLDRPESRNALIPEMVEEIGAAVAACKHADVRAVLITGSGGAFCAGADVKALVETLESGGPEALSQSIRELADALHHNVVLPLRRPT